MPSPSTTERGRRGEERAVRALVGRGLTIVERNYRCRLGELDIVARDRDTLVFVEVRSRADDSRGSAAFAVDWKKQVQVARVAAHYLTRRRGDWRTCRFDVVAITGEDVEIVENAFESTNPWW